MHICGVMVGVLTLSAVNRGLVSGQTNDYDIGISCFSAEHALNQDNSGVACLCTDCCFSELENKKSTTHIGLVQN